MGKSSGGKNRNGLFQLNTGQYRLRGNKERKNESSIQNKCQFYDSQVGGQKKGASNSLSRARLGCRARLAFGSTLRPKITPTLHVKEGIWKLSDTFEFYQHTSIQLLTVKKFSCHSIHTSVYLLHSHQCRPTYHCRTLFSRLYLWWCTSCMVQSNLHRKARTITIKITSPSECL